jgi:hypothetical protein
MDQKVFHNVLLLFYGEPMATKTPLWLNIRKGLRGMGAKTVVDLFCGAGGLSEGALGPKSGKLNCTKRGGVCSLRNFHEPTAEGDLSFGPITATCPNRFLEQGIVIKHIAELLLGTDAPLFAKELPFLKRPKSALAEAAVEETLEDAELEDSGLLDSGSEDVGRIDLVLVNPNDRDKWCAVEVQAVYFSGAEMASDYPDILAYSGNGVPLPAKGRRPDFRSSGPKRLMPQLMIKVPTLRRWGHKMVVVVDEPFFDAMDPMEQADHISNCDIVWVVAKFDDSLGVSAAPLTVAKTVLTTLENAVKGLTAGQPTTLPEFEEKLDSKTAAAFP